MAYREDTRVTPAEAASFLLLPETCPAIDAAFDRFRVAAVLTEDAIQRELRARRIEPSRAMVEAIQDATARVIGPAQITLQREVLMTGTFPLRLALVRQIEKTMPPGQPESRYVHWLRAAGVAV